MKMVPLALILSIAAAASAPACDQPVTFTSSQIEGRLSTLASGAVGPLEKVTAFRELACSDDDAVRLMAEEAALRAGGQALRASLLKSILFDREVLILQPYDDGSLTDEQRAFIEDNPVIRLPFTSKDNANSCIGTHGNDCRTGNVLDISGTGVAVSHSGSVGELVLNDAGLLEGIWVPDRSSVRVPVRARLR